MSTALAIRVPSSTECNAIVCSVLKPFSGQAFIWFEKPILTTTPADVRIMRFIEGIERLTRSVGMEINAGLEYHDREAFTPPDGAKISFPIRAIGQVLQVEIYSDSFAGQDAAITILEVGIQRMVSRYLPIQPKARKRRSLLGLF